jgi:hypothetical protein
MTFTLWDHYHEGIKIQSDDKIFFHAASADLNKLRSKPIGQDLLSVLSKRCLAAKLEIEIVVPQGNDMLETIANTRANVHDFANAVRTFKTLPGTNIQYPGKGSASRVSYNPWGDTHYAAITGVQTPCFIVLGHELIHSLHVVSGNRKMGPSGDFFTRWNAMYMQEEALTVGLGPYVNTRISENALRREWALPLRTYYLTPNDCSGMPSLTGSS